MLTEQIETTPCSTQFMGIEIEIAPDVLVPREETEILGRAAIAILRELPGHQLVVDMCCGSGNLACAIASVIDDVAVWASDLTDSSVTLARRNLERLKLNEKVQVFQGDLFAALPFEELGGRVDLVICNPPYISTSRLEGEKSYLLQSEPREAFDGGPYGLSLHQRVITDALRYLKPGGWIALEFGEGQERQLAALFKRAGGYHNFSYLPNEQGTPRVVIAQKNSASES